ncbi:hypothetical protein [Tepidimonas taiwanensis]|uniref:hypothetical protein n=1 Tax=Tepidimonas taiwanensis TaxID=307486 RepID=UPI000733DA80|nr:hypothetical protein [Tepidimonas taiwanensis]
MIADPKAQQRLLHFVRLAGKELQHLQLTDVRLFAVPMDAQRVDRLAADPELAERVDAFVARFGRLQDTLGDKVLPAYLVAHGERLSTFVENLDRAEKLGIVSDAQTWLDMRRLRNQMIHEYVEDPLVLASALNAAHRFVPTLAAVTGWFQARVHAD